MAKTGPAYLARGPLLLYVAEAQPGMAGLLEESVLVDLDSWLNPLLETIHLSTGVGRL